MIAQTETLILLGIEPRDAETEYGWIEPVVQTTASVAPIRRFWEKPTAALARALLERGCLWNSYRSATPGALACADSIDQERIEIMVRLLSLVGHDVK